jgi:hypothetical protein
LNIISINVFDRPDFLKKQLENIKYFMKEDYIVILNCNNYMQKVLINENLEKTLINPEPIEKERFHGYIAQGIYSNIKYSLENKIEFKYFITLSSRVLFYNELNNLDLFYKNNKNDGQNKDLINYNWWHWPSFKNTLLYLYFKENYDKVAYSLHEGLTFNSNVCKNILNFLETFPEIKNNLFEFNSCVEEFALQTISANYMGDNSETGFCTLLYQEKELYVKNYTPEEANCFLKNKYVYRSHKV